MKKVLIIEDNAGTLEMLGYIAIQAEVEAVPRSNVLPIAVIQRVSPE